MNSFIVPMDMSATTMEGLLAACGSSPASGNSSTTLGYANWASAESATKNQVDQTIQDFETANKVKINNIAIPFDQMLQQLETMTNGGNPPNVIELSGNWP